MRTSFSTRGRRRLTGKSGQRSAPWRIRKGACIPGRSCGDPSHTSIRHLTRIPDEVRRLLPPLMIFRPGHKGLPISRSDNREGRCSRASTCKMVEYRAADISVCKLTAFGLSAKYCLTAAVNLGQEVFRCSLP